MGRSKTPESVKWERYNRVFLYLKNEDQPVCETLVCEALGLKQSQLSAALQYGRRELAKKENSIKQVIMSCPRGLFVPSTDKEIEAWILQYTMDAESRMRTMIPYMEYLKENNPTAFSRLKETWNSTGTDEMTPFAVFDKYMNLYN